MGWFMYYMFWIAVIGGFYLACFVGSEDILGKHIVGMQHMNYESCRVGFWYWQGIV